AASTFDNNFIFLLHDRPPKSQERPNGRVRGRALLPCSQVGERSATWPLPSYLQTAADEKVRTCATGACSSADASARSSSGSSSANRAWKDCAHRSAAISRTRNGSPRRSTSARLGAGGAGQA